MLDLLRLMAIFVRVADCGSFRAAADQLGLSAPMVSQHVGMLEARLGKPLLYRTTRSMSLTREGEALLVSARQMADAAEAGIAAVTGHSGDAIGELRLTAPAMLPFSALSACLTDFASRHPGIHLDITYSDIRQDIVQDGFDLAIRIGWMVDSSLRSTKLGEYDRWLVAAPGLAQSFPATRSASDLRQWPWVRFRARQGPLELIGPDKETARITGPVQVSVDNVMAMREMACAGLGLAALPTHLVMEDVEAGRLIRILPQWSLASPGVYAVWHPNAPRGGLVSRLVSALQQSGKAVRRV